MRFTLIFCLCALAACAVPSTTSDRQALDKALAQTPIVDLLGARAIARELALGCEGLDLANGIGAWREDDGISALRATRAAEFDQVEPTAVLAAGRRQSDALDARYGVPYRIFVTRRSAWRDGTCAAGWREANSETLIGLMLVRTGG